MVIVAIVSCNENESRAVVSYPNGTVKVEFYSSCLDRNLESVRLYSKTFEGFEKNEFLYYNFRESQLVEPIEGTIDTYDKGQLKHQKIFYLDLEDLGLRHRIGGVRYLPIRVDSIETDTLIVIDKVGNITVDSNSLMQATKDLISWELSIRDSSQNAFYILSAKDNFSSRFFVLNPDSDLEIFIWDRENNKPYDYKDVVYRKKMRCADLKCGDNFVYID